jgi:hypothetical protein
MILSQISNKMQVPDSIKAVPGFEGTQPDPYIPGQMAAVTMQVPDRITLVDGENYMLVIPPLVERGLYCNQLVR